MKPLPAFVASCFFLIITLPAGAEDYQGAEAVLKQADEQADKAATAGESDWLRQWHADLRTYHDQIATLPPDQAARDWLALFDRARNLPASIPEQVFGGSVPTHLLETFQTLPPPAAWEALASQAAARPLPPAGSADLTTPALQIITATLQGDPDSTRHSIRTLEQSVDNNESTWQSGLRSTVEQLNEAFLTQTGDKAGLLAAFEAQLARYEPGRDASFPSGESAMLRMNSLSVPDLLAYTDTPHAEALLRRVFAAEAPSVSFRGERTEALARKVAMTMGDDLKLPAWGLVDTLDATALYELLEKRFPNGGNGDSQRRMADAYYLMGLIAAGRVDDARLMTGKIVRSSGVVVSGTQEDALNGISDTAMTELATRGYANEVFRFFDGLLADHPEYPYWETYTTAAILAGQQDAMLARIKGAADRTDLKPGIRNQLRAAYGKGLLAADRVAEALPILREQTAAGVRAVLESPDDENALSIAQNAAETIVRLAVIGGLIGDQALVNEQLDALAAVAKKQPLSIANTSGPSNESLAEIYLAAGRGPELERLFTACLVAAERFDAESRRQEGSLAVPELGNSQIVSLLTDLADLYYKAGRYADIVALLDHARNWGAPDLAKISYGENDFDYQVARALQKTGHADAALRVVDAYLENHGGSDPAYALLLELLPPDRAEARLNELFRGDQFEERPLIWRAVVQLGQNRLGDAEKSVRQAISIDPSDGDEGRGDRLRAYAVLADILERKGDTETAAQTRKAVQAIRLSEDADRFHAAGLLTHAVGMYEKALGYFSKAYCIQSRLAVQLNAMGKFDEAAAHYERAYELMPESFGRMESHCFGCEHVFAGERAQSVAERVFQKLAAKQPDNARVHYLLGYLRNEQERPAEAAQEFREAVRLDPDYINAWKQLASTSDRPADVNQAELNLLRLDPRRKHDSADLSTVSDLKALWTAVEAAEKFAVREPADLYPLAASQAALAQQRQPRVPDPGSDLQRLFESGSSSGPLAPWMAVLKNRVIATTLPFLRKGAPGGDSSD